MMSPVLWDLIDVALALGLALRLTRLIVADDIGNWYIVQPAYSWAARHQEPLPEIKEGEEPVEHVFVPGWRLRLVSGLTCPFCVGFWICGLVLFSLWIAGGPGQAHDLWRWIAGVFALNWVAAHLGARAGDKYE